jgi:hypothetical protein
MHAKRFDALTRRLTITGSRRAAVRALTAGGLGLLSWPRAADARDRCRRGTIQKFTGPPERVEVTFQAHRGLTEIVVTRSENADTVVPPFNPGTTDPVVVSSTKIDQSMPARVDIETRNQRDVVRPCRYMF